MIMALFIWLSGVNANAATETINCTSRQSSYNCLLCNCYFETRGEPLVGKIAVAKTVLSRMDSNEFPDTACGVVFQPSQFSWTNDSYRNTVKVSKPEDQAALQQCRDAANTALDEGPNGLLYFYNPRKVTPSWARKMRNCGRAGEHVFMVPKSETCPRNLGANPPNTVAPKKSSGGGTAR